MWTLWSIVVLLESPEKPSPSQRGDENQQDDYHNEDDAPGSPHGSPSSGSTSTPHLTKPRKDPVARSDITIATSSRARCGAIKNGTDLKS
jgi:hypothetical protein